MMPTRKRNFLLKILIILISITLFGFQNVPNNVDPGAANGNEPGPYGYIEVLLYSHASAGSGASSVSFTWHPVRVFLPIIGYDSRGHGIFGGGAFTYAQGNGRAGPASTLSGFPVYWHIQGSVAPPRDCTIKLSVEETWFPGHNIGCEPTGVVGCITDTWLPDFIPGVEFSFPFNRAWGTVVRNASGLNMGLTAIVLNVVTGIGTPNPGGISALACESRISFPVIPQ
jgi:hypothetical protein